MEGLQLWVGLPVADERADPDFQHYDGDAFPELTQGAAKLRVLAGTAFGVTSPVKTHSPLFYVEAVLLEAADDAGAIDAGVRAITPAHVVLLGGAPLDGGPRHMHWNFVASTRELIEDAKHAWKERRFPVIPTDAAEFIPLPEPF